MLFMKFMYNVQVLTILLFIESFLISLIAFGTFDIIAIIVIMFISGGFVFLMGGIFQVFGLEPPREWKLPDGRGKIVRSGKAYLISSFFLMRIFLVILFVFVISVFFDFNFLVFVIILDLLSLINSQMIKMEGNMIWRIYDEGTDIGVKIIFAWYFLLNPLYYWVSIVLIGNIVILVLMYWDLEYRYLKAFLPNVMYMISVFGTIWVFPLALITFFDYLFYYFFYYTSPLRI